MALTPPDFTQILTGEEESDMDAKPVSSISISAGPLVRTTGVHIARIRKPLGASSFTPTVMNGAAQAISASTTASELFAQTTGFLLP